MDYYKDFLITFTVLQLILYHANSLQITSLYVPGGASHEAPMDCRYDLEGGKLYDVKWYKDGEQFYRCMENGSVQEFPVDGVKIYHTKTATSGSCPLTVTNLTPKSAGEYKCEVSLDEPSFKIVSQWARMRFIESSRRVQNRSIDNSIEVEEKLQKHADSGCKSLILHFNLIITSLCIYHIII